jgi:ABC-type uncharacterized transport system ATPase subunit
MEPDVSKHVIKVENLAKTFDSAIAVDNISFEVQRGATTAFLAFFHAARQRGLLLHIGE